jgi:hypothetical protein
MFIKRPSGAIGAILGPTAPGEVFTCQDCNNEDDNDILLSSRNNMIE